MLKFIEICHNLDRMKNIIGEKQEKSKIEAGFTLSKMLGMNGKQNRMMSTRIISPTEINSGKEQAAICIEIFNIFRNSVEIMDEVDILLHPLKSELNWPLGVKAPLDFTQSQSGSGARWAIPSHLLDAIFTCCGMPVLADIADSRQASMFYLIHITIPSIINVITMIP
jgi:hypothetical protein